jgi:hypothetical protein
MRRQPRCGGPQRSSRASPRSPTGEAMRPWRAPALWRLSSFRRWARGLPSPSRGLPSRRLGRPVWQKAPPGAGGAGGRRGSRRCPRGLWCAPCTRGLSRVRSCCSSHSGRCICGRTVLFFFGGARWRRRCGSGCRVRARCGLAGLPLLLFLLLLAIPGEEEGKRI